MSGEGGYSTTLHWSWECACQFYSRSRLFWGMKRAGWGGLSTTWDCHLKVAGDDDRKFTGFICCKNWAGQVSRGGWSTTSCLGSQAYRNSFAVLFCCLQWADEVVKMCWLFCQQGCGRDWSTILIHSHQWRLARQFRTSWSRLFHCSTFTTEVADNPIDFFGENLSHSWWWSGNVFMRRMWRSNRWWWWNHYGGR